MFVPHVVDRVHANRGAGGRAGGDGDAAVDRVEPTAALDGEHEVRALLLVERLLEADTTATLAGDPEVALELPHTARVGVVATLGTLVPTRG
jgi:hypothetical protein